MTDMYVYVIGPSPVPEGDCLLKVGMSNSPTTRCRSLQRRSEVPLEVYTSFAVPNDDALLVERYAQWLLRDHWHTSEWFNVSAEAAQGALDTAIEAVRRGERAPFDFRNPEPKTERFGMNCDEQFLKAVDEWRRRQAELPNRSEAIRRLVQERLEEMKLWPK